MAMAHGTCLPKHQHSGELYAQRRAAAVVLVPGDVHSFFLFRWSMLGVESKEARDPRTLLNGEPHTVTRLTIAAESGSPR